MHPPTAATGRPAARRLRPAAVVCAALLAGAGCAAPDPHVLAVDEATARVDDYARQLAALAGGVLTDPVTAAGPCGSGGSYLVEGTYRVPLRAARHPRARARLRDTWRANGFTVTVDRTSDGWSGALAGFTPDGWEVGVASTAPPRALTVVVRSPCLTAPA